MNQVTIKRDKMEYQIAEAYKALRTNLQFCGEDKKVIAVTSCTPDEKAASACSFPYLWQRVKKEF